MAQGERSAAFGREADHAGEKKHERESEAGAADFLCMFCICLRLSFFFFQFPLRLPTLLPPFSHPSSPYPPTPSLTTLLRTDAPNAHPQTLHHPPRTLPQPTRRLHPRATHRAPEPQQRPSSLCDSRTGRRPPGHAVCHDGQNADAGARERRWGCQGDHGEECAKSDEV